MAGNTGSILVTGGAGYIGSHACVSLLQAGYPVVVLDNFCNSQPSTLERVQQIAGKSLLLEQCDIRDRIALDNAFSKHTISAVIHFAGLKAVGESCQQPLFYYENNVGGTINLLQAMQQADVRRLIFSSSATVYGFPENMPVNEDTPLASYNPYGQTKQVIEQILGDLCAPGMTESWQIALLRYFNPAGAHESGLIGEDPNGIPNNLLPYIAQVAAGHRECLPVFGDDYATPDGTGVRDYIHVQDLVSGHLLALKKLLHLEADKVFCRAYNLGTGKGYSVLEMIKTFEQVNNVSVPYRIMPRRSGDVASCWADASRAREELGWEAEKDLREMLTDSWRWQCKKTTGVKKNN
jgi:UDP-glucose 4-epimerase